MGRGEGREPDRRWLNGVPPPFRIRRIVRCRTTQALLRLRRENERMRVQNIVIPATDFGSTVTFYRDVLGLPVLQESAAFCFLRAGGVNIAVHPVSPGSLFAPTGHGIYLDLAVGDLAQVRDRLARASVPVVREWMDGATGFLAVADPNGNLLELYEGSPETDGGDGKAAV